MKKILFSTINLLLLLASCNLGNKKTYNTQKLGANDPFAKTMVASEFFDLNADIGNVIEGGKGSIISFPKGCFLDKNGNEITGNVKVELAEALSYDDMLLSNLTTTSNGAPLETDGMIYLNAKTADGADVNVNPKKPLYVEIPSMNKRPGMMAYVGERDDQGNMNWVDPKPIENYLINVDLQELDFLPPGFAEEVKRGMPFKHYKVATKVLTDSLYYSLAKYYGAGFAQEAPATAPTNLNLNEPYYNPNAVVDNGKYTKESYEVNSSKPEKGAEHGYSDTSSLNTENEWGIDPATVKTIRSDKFSHTFIATREFEKRMATIFQTCNNSILLLYVNNLDKNLWEIDEMAAKQLGEASIYGKKFKAFAALRQTNVRGADENATLLKGYFEKQLAAIKDSLALIEGIAQAQVQEHNRIVDSVADEYRKLLFKREAYRMQRYGFAWTNTGWINVDTGVIVKYWDGQKLEVTVTGGKDFDRVETYLMLESMKSIYHLETEDKEIHFVGQDPKRSMLMPLNKNSKIVAVAYKGDSVYIGVTTYLTGSSETASVSVSPSTELDVKRVLNEIEKGTFTGKLSSSAGDKKAEGFAVSKPGGWAEENSVAVDLAYQSFFYKETLYQNQQNRENSFIYLLREKAFPCGCGGQASIEEGRSLFKSNCASCHNPVADGTGPALAGATGRHSMEWLVSWIRNWHDLVNQGDRAAITMANSRPAEMNVFAMMDDCSVKAIFRYIDSQTQVPAQ
jgi:hypothetical protein